MTNMTFFIYELPTEPKTKIDHNSPKNGSSEFCKKYVVDIPDPLLLQNFLYIILKNVRFMSFANFQPQKNAQSKKKLSITNRTLPKQLQ